MNDEYIQLIKEEMELFKKLAEVRKKKLYADHRMAYVQTSRRKDNSIICGTSEKKFTTHEITQAAFMGRIRCIGAKFCEINTYATRLESTNTYGTIWESIK